MTIKYKFDRDGETFVCETFDDLTQLHNYHDIVTIDCSCNNLAELPTLPNSLEHLDCCFNRLASLPTLPIGLTHLHCYYNLLTVLPTLPNSLEYLNCSSNELSVLPKLPDNLEYINCSYNILTVLPTLPNNLLRIHCHGNNLQLLPTFGDSLKFNYYYNNPVYESIRDKCRGDINIYHRENEIYANKLVRWYLDCRENPVFKFCRDRLNKEYDALLMNEDANEIMN